MSFIDELRNGLSQFLAIIRKDGETDILSMPYAEYSLQCFVIYKDILFENLLHEDAPLARALRSIGVEQPRDQLMIFIETFYLFCRTQTEQND